MVVRVGTSGVTVGSVKTGGSRTQVAKIVIGTPIRQVSPDQAVQVNLFSGGVNGIDTTGVEDGWVLVYDAGEGKFRAVEEIDNTDVNGGQY